MRRTRMPRAIRPSSPARTLTFVAFALAGVLIGHAASYALALPDPHHRDLVLQGTGHGYLPGLAEVAAVLVIGALAALVASAAVGRRDRAPGLHGVAASMVAAQVLAFATLEIVERLVAGASLAGLGQDHLLPIGLVTQAVVAVVCAAAVSWLARASVRIAGALTRRPTRRRPGPLLAFAGAELGVPALGAGRVVQIRGPPPR